jgi:hypothetical protein
VYLEETSGRFTCEIFSLSLAMHNGAKPLARYRPERLSLVSGSPAGGALDKTEILSSQYRPNVPVLRCRLPNYAYAFLVHADLCCTASILVASTPPVMLGPPPASHLLRHGRLPMDSNSSPSTCTSVRKVEAVRPKEMQGRRSIFL